MVGVEEKSGSRKRLRQPQQSGLDADLTRFDFER